MNSLSTHTLHKIRISNGQTGLRRAGNKNAHRNNVYPQQPDQNAPSSEQHATYNNLRGSIYYELHVLLTRTEISILRPIH